MHGFHHLRRRVRISHGLEQFPSRSAFKRSLDHVMYGVALLAPVALLPQIFQIYGTKSSAGVSLLTWSLLACVNLMWMTYGIIHKDKQIILANVLLILSDVTIISGLLLY
jgi:uncharacterized protein with PQ loop repeat